MTTKVEGAQGKFPNSPAGQQACVAEIMAAIHNFEDIVDKTGKNGRAAQSHNRFEQGFYQRFEIEMKCWQLLVRLFFFRIATRWSLSNKIHNQLVGPEACGIFTGLI